MRGAAGEVAARVHEALAGFHWHLTTPVDVPTLVEAAARLGRMLVRPRKRPGSAVD